MADGDQTSAGKQNRVATSATEMTGFLFFPRVTSPTNGGRVGRVLFIGNSVLVRLEVEGVASWFGKREVWDPGGLRQLVAVPAVSCSPLAESI